MQVAKLGFVLALGAIWMGRASAQSPAEYLRRSIDARRTTIASLIQSQTMLSASDERILMKIDYDGRGRSRRTMLQPLRMQGQVMIDDGKNLMVLVPDERQLKVVTSASRPMPTDFRMELITKNYRMSVRKSDPIAGRSTVMITCRPQYKGMPFRRISVDEKTYFPLRVTSTLDGKATTLLDTLSFDQPKSMPESLFQAPTNSGVKVVRLTVPSRVTTEDDAQARLPFRPWVPRSLPLGFVAESMEIISAGSASALVIRLTDGFNIATIYQWDVNEKIPGLGDMTEMGSFTSRGLRMVIVGDLPKSVTDKLTEYLSKESLNL